MDGTRLWQIDIGPNMISAGEVETNITAFDWDEDGKAELLMRAMDGTIVYASDGTKQVIGDPTKNYRDSVLHTANMTYSMAGNTLYIWREPQPNCTTRPCNSPSNGWRTARRT